jgi:exodeoxyribonuclease V alpha subunit
MGINMTAFLEGQIERITYSNEETGYTVAKVRVKGQRDLVTVVGNLIVPAPGEIIKMTGAWMNHPRYGEQFRVQHYESVVPASVYGIEKYLGSGLIKGIGPIMAKRIVQKFDRDTLHVIENEIENLAHVDGIGKKRIEMIKRAWDEQKEIREVMIFLQAHGVGSGYATKIFKHYGNRSVKIVRENPYRLARDIFGIGFMTADRIAEKLGFPKDSELRAEAGIIYVLHELSDEGHVYYPYELLVQRCQEILGVDRETIVSALAVISSHKMIVVEDLENGEDEDSAEDGKAVYLAKFHLSEVSIVERMKGLVVSTKAIRSIDTDKAIAWVQGQLAITLARKQVEAIQCGTHNKVMVITGGPGTGKTTIISAIVKIFSKLGVRIMLAAPTGRAAKRMSEATSHEARTIHRMLEYSIQKGHFQRNEDRPLECDILIVDEASMIDTILMHHLLKAVPREATFILVGDVNQLPSVGAGTVLKDLIASRSVPVVELNEIFRQASESLIVVNAHKINRGLLPPLKPSGPSDDFYFIEQEDPEEALKIIIELNKERIPARFGFDPIDHIQVLTPMHKGIVGVGNINRELQNALNPGPVGLVRGARSFRLGDKVMQVRNNYDKEVFNGDLGRITKIDLENQKVSISFDGCEIPYGFTDLDEVVLAYAVSVHKSQGCEYPAVIVPIFTQHYVLLQRNLIYTAVTRGRELVVMIGTRKALRIGIDNDKTQWRYTHLRQRLSRAFAALHE